MSLNLQVFLWSSKAYPRVDKTYYLLHKPQVVIIIVSATLVPFEAPRTRCLGLTVAWLQGSSKCAPIFFSLVYGQHSEERIDSEDYTTGSSNSGKKAKEIRCCGSRVPHCALGEQNTNSPQGEDVAKERMWWAAAERAGRCLGRQTRGRTHVPVTEPEPTRDGAGAGEEASQHVASGPGSAGGGYEPVVSFVGGRLGKRRLSSC